MSFPPPTSRGAGRRGAARTASLRARSGAPSAVRDMEGAKRGRGEGSGSAAGGAPEEGSAPAPKQARTVAGAAADANKQPVVRLRCMDDDNRGYTEVKLSLLRHYNCRLYAEVSHDAAQVDAQGVAFYRVDMTRAMLQTFVRSLTHGQLSLSKGVSVTEALTTLEYENINFGTPTGEAMTSACVKQATAGVGYEKRSEKVGEYLKSTCEQIAGAIANWPYLEAGLNSVLEGVEPEFTATATRAWVRLMHRPATLMPEGPQESIVSLVRKWPSWLKNTLRAIGMVHRGLVQEGMIDPKARDAATFEQLRVKVNNDTLGALFATRYDKRGVKKSGEERRDCSRGDRFAEEIKAVILDSASAAVAAQEAAAAGEGGGPSQPTLAQQMGIIPGKDDSLRFAKGCIAWAETINSAIPVPGLLFSGKCLDVNDKSPERVRLARALHERGIRVVRWAAPPFTQTYTPACFPPSWGYSSNEQWADVELDFGCGR